MSSRDADAQTADGLSPRVRGNRDVNMERVPNLRIGSIPARAGEPYGTARANNTPIPGLSPRVRGNHV